MIQKMLFDITDEPTFTNRSVKSVTFQGKLDLPIHRWYRLTPSFSPKLAHDIADYFELGQTDLVLDPFSGVGTVPLCMKYRNIPACSVEINPYLFFVSTVKTRTYTELKEIASCLDTFCQDYAMVLRKSKVATAPQAYLKNNEDYIPGISKPERWWSPGNLAQLAALRRLIQDHDSLAHIDLIKMGVLSILIPVSNAKHNHVSLTFAKNPLQTVDVADILSHKCRDIVADLRAVADSRCSEVTVHHGNSKELATVLRREREVSAVITSPPYPNRFSYARETRPHLFFSGLIKSASDVGKLETDAIGGTWGKATSVLSKGVAPCNDLITSLLAPYIHDIHTDGDLMAYYVTKYFNDIYAHAEQVDAVSKKRCRLAYVIGNSKFYGNPLPSDEILGNIFQSFGFNIDRIDRMRRRQSKKGLYEAVVFMSRSSKKRSPK